MVYSRSEASTRRQDVVAGLLHLEDLFAWMFASLKTAPEAEGKGNMGGPWPVRCRLHRLPQASAPSQLRHFTVVRDSRHELPPRVPTSSCLLHGRIGAAVPASYLSCRGQYSAPSCIPDENGARGATECRSVRASGARSLGGRLHALAAWHSGRCMAFAGWSYVLLDLPGFFVRRECVRCSDSFFVPTRPSFPTWP